MVGIIQNLSLHVIAQNAVERGNVFFRQVPLYIKNKKRRSVVTDKVVEKCRTKDKNDCLVVCTMGRLVS